MFPILRDDAQIYPSDFALAYDAAHDLALVARERGVMPRDIEATWPNVLGFLRRIPGQPYYRPAPNDADDVPTRDECIVFYDALVLTGRRLRTALVRKAATRK